MVERNHDQRAAPCRSQSRAAPSNEDVTDTMRFGGNQASRVAAVEDIVDTGGDGVVETATGSPIGLLKQASWGKMCDASQNTGGRGFRIFCGSLSESAPSQWPTKTNIETKLLLKSTAYASSPSTSLSPTTFHSWELTQHVPASTLRISRLSFG